MTGEFGEKSRESRSDHHTFALFANKHWPELIALYEAARELKAAGDDITGTQHEDCSKPPCSGCRQDDAMDAMEEVLYALDRKAAGDE